MAEKKIGRYQVKSEIGVGGMATVFLAFDPSFKRDVAIKILPTQFLDDPVLRARFEREAQTIAGLEHPAIVPVYDFGEQDGQLYLVMRYMAGGTLSDRLRKGPLPVDQAAQIIARLAPALDEAHRHGVIHRDLKPGNILFDQYGNAFISDFGIAHLTEATTVLTGEAIIGTPAYMSPEQARGDENLDGRSDIYALGTILFEILSGAQPYKATTPIAVAMKHITEPVPSILKVKPSLPAEVETIIATAMAKDREKRYPRATQMAEALQRIAGQPAAPPIAAPTITDQAAGRPVAASTTPLEMPAPRPAPETPPPTPPPSPPVTPPSSPALSRSSPSAAMLAPALQPSQNKRRMWIFLGGAAILVVVCVVGVGLMGGSLMLSNLFRQPTAAVTIAMVAPQPTSTPSADSATGTPAPATTPVAVDLFRDDFSDPNSGWPSGEDRGSQYGYVNGSYRIYENDINYTHWVTPDKLFGNVSIEVDATKVGGADDNYFGILCRYQDERNFYYLLVSSNGYYLIGKYKNGQYNDLLKDGWAYSDYIHQGKTTNHLRADCVGDTLTLYVNDSRLGEAIDGDFGQGDIGLTVAALSTAGTEILFDNFVAQKP